MNIRDIAKLSLLAGPFGLAACSDGKGGVDPVRTGALVAGTAIAAGLVASADKEQNNRGRDRDRDRDRPRGHYYGDGHGRDHDGHRRWERQLERDWRRAERRENREERRERRERRDRDGKVCTFDGGFTFYRC